ncbi:MAG TPA: HD domain-containing phosphohydrolase [Candidatus Omnitrophota bacterium]|nr:HD domain-containing phosphohydrolase [Candidatus Omnitrophota bacterium]
MVYRLINSTYNVQELSLRLTRLLCQFIKAESAMIYLLEPGKKKLILKAIFNNKINILIDKKKELDALNEDEKKVLAGFCIYKKHVLGLPLVADDNIGAVMIHRKKTDAPFSEFDKDMLSVVSEQSVTAIKNLQLHQDHQQIILGSIKFIGTLLEQHGFRSKDKIITHTPAYFEIIKAVAQKLKVPADTLDSLYYASVLRDTGAIDVPYEILSKTSRLTPEEFKVIKMQPTRHAALIGPVGFLKPVLPIILYRHEKYDGSGYPSGLKKEQIPLGARIVSVVDAFEAMTTKRPYKVRLSIEKAILELKRNSGTQFDPKVIDVFVSLSQQKKFRNNLRLTHK